MDIFYNTKEFAQMLKVHRRTVNRMIHKGTLRAVNMGSIKKPSWRIYDGELQRFMSENYENNKKGT